MLHAGSDAGRSTNMCFFAEAERKPCEKHGWQENVALVCSGQVPPVPHKEFKIEMAMYAVSSPKCDPHRGNESIRSTVMNMRTSILRPMMTPMGRRASSKSPRDRPSRSSDISVQTTPE